MQAVEARGKTVVAFKDPRYEYCGKPPGCLEAGAERLDGNSGFRATMSKRATGPGSKEGTAHVVARIAGGIRGVFFTHLHVDHISGMPDIPGSVPLYVGRSESTATSFQNYSFEAPPTSCSRARRSCKNGRSGGMTITKESSSAMSWTFSATVLPLRSACPATRRAARRFYCGRPRVPCC